METPSTKAEQDKTVRHWLMVRERVAALNCQRLTPKEQAELKKLEQELPELTRQVDAMR